MNWENSNRKSGRYPWGEGVEAFPNAMAFVEKVKTLKNQGVLEEEVLKEINALLPEDRRMKPTEFRVAFRFAWGGRHAEIGNEIIRLHDEKYAWSEIACKMKLSESWVERIYNNRVKELEICNKKQILLEALKTQAEKCDMILVPYKECKIRGCRENWLDELIYVLESELDFGYFRVKCHLGNICVLAKPGITQRYVLSHESRITPFIWPEDLDPAVES